MILLADNQGPQRIIKALSGKLRPWSDCANAQADIGIRRPHMPEDVFLNDASHIQIAKKNHHMH